MCSSAPILCFASVIASCSYTLPGGQYLMSALEVNTSLLYSKNNKNNCRGRFIGNLLPLIMKYKTKRCA